MSPTSDATPLIDGLLTKVADNDPEETKEWLESLEALIQDKGGPRARYILLSMLAEARKKNVSLPAQTTTPYVNTIAVENEPYFPGDEDAERTYRRWLRWNAAVMVTRAQRPGVGVGGPVRAAVLGFVSCGVGRSYGAGGGDGGVAVGSGLGLRGGVRPRGPG